MNFLKGLMVAGLVVLAMNAVLIYVATDVQGGDPVVSSYESEAR